MIWFLLFLMVMFVLVIGSWLFFIVNWFTRWVVPDDVLIVNMVFMVLLFGGFLVFLLLV